MFPSKNTLDDVVEMYRLFPRSPRTSENDMLLSSPTWGTSQRSFNQYSMAQSSSSTDTSPDSFPDMTAHLQSEFAQHYNQRDNFCYKHDRAQYETPKLQQYHSKPSDVHDIPHAPQLNDTLMRCQRPIVGRKILATENQVHRDVSNSWPEDSSQYANTMNSGMNESYYELFPVENKDFRTPVKRPMSPKMLHMSSRMTDISGMSSGMSDVSGMTLSPRRMEASPSMMSLELNRSPMTSPKSQYSARFSTPAFKEPIRGPSTSFHSNLGPPKICTFCRKNGETPLVYMTHAVKEKVGNKHVVTCPILRSHVCSICGAFGDNAHTISYCPVLRSSNNGRPLQSTTISLKNTRVKSNGRRRY